MCLFVSYSPSRAGVAEPGALQIASPREAPLHTLALLSLHPGGLNALVLGDHLIPREAIAWFCLGVRCIPVFFLLVLFSLLLLFLQAFPLLDLIVPEIYISNVSVD